MAPPARRRPRLLWPTTQALLLLLPLWASLGLRSELKNDADATFAAEISVRWFVPWALSMALVLGAGGEAFVPRAQRHDRAAVFQATSWRMLAVLTVTPLSLWIVLPLDPTDLASPWRALATWMAAAVVPLWATAAHLRLHGRGPLRALLVAGLTTGTLVGAAIAVARAFALTDVALLSPVGAGGVVASIGLFLAASERVPARPSRAVPASGLLALAVSAALAAILARPPAGALWVVAVESVDEGAHRAIVGVRSPNTQTRLLEVDLASGAGEPLPRRVATASYTPLGRVEVWSGLLDGLRGDEAGESSGRPCVRREGRRRCVGLRVERRPVRVMVHPARPLVLFASPKVALVWDLESDRTWTVTSPERRMVWACFAGDDTVIWRLPTPDGPYEQQQLRLDAALAAPASAPVDQRAAIRDLPVDHRLSCLDVGVPTTAATLVRSRGQLGREATLTGPGLPGGSAPLPPEIGEVEWSRDGQRAVLSVVNERTLLFYDATLGLSAPAEALGAEQLSLSPDGQWLAHRVGSRAAVPPLLVRRFVGGEVVARLNTEVQQVRWDREGRLLRVEDGRLRAFHPPSGPEVVLFPAEGE